MMVAVSKGGLEPSTAGRGTENFFLNLFSLNVSIFRRRKTLKKKALHVCQVGGSNCQPSDLKGACYATMPPRHLVYT